MIFQQCSQKYIYKKTKQKKGTQKARGAIQSATPKYCEALKNRSQMPLSESFQRAGEQILNEWTWRHTHTLHTRTHTVIQPQRRALISLRVAHPGSSPDLTAVIPAVAPACRAAESEPLGGTGGARCHAVCPYGFGWKDASLSLHLFLSSFVLSWFSW